MCLKHEFKKSSREDHPRGMIFPGSLLLKVFLFVGKTVFSEVISCLEKVELASLLDDFLWDFSHFILHQKKERDAKNLDSFAYFSQV